ncbi:MAG: cytochrome c maturation protein CcmE [Nitrospirota bacterium]|nr:cytochrome c maturation protein CcmE [Nitrospirota bacterium]
MSGKKIGIVGSVLVVIAGLSYLALGNFGENLVYFMTPSEVVTLEQDLYGKKMRVAGMVVEASMKVVPETLKISFDLTDGAETIPVAFEGIPPDLFKEGKGAVVEGYWDQDQIFHSHMIMAKHEEDYMPIEMKNAGESLPTLGLIKTLHVEK